MATSGLEDVRTHLEYLGYTIPEQAKPATAATSATATGTAEPPKQESLLATHPSKPNLLVRDYAGGFLLYSLFKGTDSSKKEREGFLNYLNAVNATTAALRCYVDKDGDFIMEAWFTGPYERGSFGRFMTVWDKDVTAALSKEEARKYIQ